MGVKVKPTYGAWLRAQGYDEGTIKTQLYRIGRVEQCYGDLDGHHAQDEWKTLISELTYSVEDERCARPNPSRIVFRGNVRNNLASYKSSVLWYRRFCQEPSVEQNGVTASAPPQPVNPDAAPSSTLRRSVSRSLDERRFGPRTLVDFELNGRAALEAIIASSQYRTAAQAVASLTLFAHPLTVRQTDGRALFPTIRNQSRVGQTGDVGGRPIMFDDNKSPIDAFLWSNGLSRRGADTQLNHIYAVSLDPDAYTALPNLCMTPAFIAKLTDTDEEVCRLLRYRSYQLYQWLPSGHSPPERPDEYEALEWAAPLPPVADVKANIVAAMSSKPKNRTVIAARTLGWLFTDLAPASA